MHSIFNEGHLKQSQKKVKIIAMGVFRVHTLRNESVPVMRAYRYIKMRPKSMRTPKSNPGEPPECLWVGLRLWSYLK